MALTSSRCLAKAKTIAAASGAKQNICTCWNQVNSCIILPSPSGSLSIPSNGEMRNTTPEAPTTFAGWLARWISELWENADHGCQVGPFHQETAKANGAVDTNARRNGAAGG